MTSVFDIYFNTDFPLNIVAHSDEGCISTGDGKLESLQLLPNWYDLMNVGMSFATYAKSHSEVYQLFV